MASPLLLFENMYETATITSSSEASGWPDDNVKDWRVGTPYRWKAGSTTPPAWVKANQGAGGTLEPDSVCIAGHNLFTAGARWKLQWSTDDASWTDAFSVQTPTNNLPQLVQFTVSGVKRYWRVYLDMAAGSFAVAPQLGVVTLGRKLSISTGGTPFSLDPYGEEDDTEWNDSDGGAFLGANFRAVRKSFQIAYDTPGLTKTGFFRAASGLNFDTHFRPHARSKPFWFAWNTDEDSADVYLCHVAGRISMPFVGSTARRSLMMNLVAYKEVA